MEGHEDMDNNQGQKHTPPPSESSSINATSNADQDNKTLKHELAQPLNAIRLTSVNLLNKSRSLSDRSFADYIEVKLSIVDKQLNKINLILSNL